MGFIKDIVITGWIAAMYFGLGCTMYMLGDTMVDMSVKTDTPITMTSLVFVWQGFGILIGCASGGSLYRRLHHSRYALMASCLIICSITTALIGWSDIYIVISCMLFLQGLSIGVQETGGVILTTIIWREAFPSVFQFVTAGMGLGCIVAPLVAGPFLLKRNATETVTTENYQDDFSSNLTLTESAKVRIHVPFYMIAGFEALTAVAFIIFSFTERRAGLPEDDEDAQPCLTDMSFVASTSNNIYNKKHFRNIKIFSTLMLFLVIGIQNVYGNCIPLFVLFSNLHWTEEQAAFLGSLFWIAFTFCRGFCVYLVRKVGTSVVLVACMVLCSAASGLFFEVDIHQFVLWLVVVVLGVASSPIFPGLMGWGEEHCPLSNNEVSIMLASCTIGHITMGVAATYFIADIGAELFIYIILGGNILILVLFILALDQSRRIVIRPEVNEKTPLIS